MCGGSGASRRGLWIRWWSEGMASEIVPHIVRNKDAFGHEEIVMMHVRNHSPIEWIVGNYPLSYAQIYTALTYYYDH